VVHLTDTGGFVVLVFRLAVVELVVLVKGAVLEVPWLQVIFSLSKRWNTFEDTCRYLIFYME